jgi:hypothetical protein
MELRHLRARIERLQQLALRIGLERERWLKCDAPVYLWEREEALTEAIRAVDDVRKVLFKICSRIESGE